MMGAFIAGGFYSPSTLSANAAPFAREDNDRHEAGDMDNDDGREAKEDDEANGLSDEAALTPDEASAVAEAANPGTKAVAVELENESGTLVYEVELNNGLEVMVDAASGDILGTERDEAD
jgi:uncharacterized membrane protein YkoI